MTDDAARALRKRVRHLQRRFADRQASVRFPAIPHLGLSERRFSFTYATGTHLHRSVSDGTWSYEPEVMATVLTCLASESGAAFIAVGANIGYFPIVISGLLGDDVTCLAYEAAPDLAATIRRGARQNDVDVDVRAMAVGDSVGIATLYLSARSDVSNSLNASFRRHRGEIDVDVTTIDHDLLPTPPAGTARPVLLVDTETTEPDVLDGARGFTAAHRPAIVCAVLAGRTEDRLQAFIDSMNYAAYALTGSGVRSRDRIEGDETYQHRDWLFWPRESSPPVDSIAQTLRVLTPGANGGGSTATGRFRQLKQQATAAVTARSGA